MDRQRQKRIYVLGGVGLITYWCISTYIRLQLDRTKAGQVPGIEAVLVGLALLGSLILVLGSTVIIVQRLWPAKSSVMDAGEKIIKCYALTGLIIADVTLFIFIPWISIAATVLGVTSLRYSYLKENKGMNNVQIYRIISIVSVIVPIINAVLPAIVE